MTKRDILDLIGEDYSATDVREVARTLRDDYDYDSIKISHAKEELCDELEGIVAKADLVEVLNSTLPGWDEEEEDSDDDSDGDED
jgi:hypothetical protein